MQSIFNLIVLSEVLVVAWLALAHRRVLAKHWRTSLVGWLVLAVTAFFNGLYWLRTGYCYDTIYLVISMADGIAFLLASDGHESK